MSKRYQDDNSIALIPKSLHHALKKLYKGRGYRAYLNYAVNSQMIHQDEPTTHAEAFLACFK